MTRACQCGGIIRQHQLTGEREAWTCNACGRYGAIARESFSDSDIESVKAKMREPAYPGKVIHVTHAEMEALLSPELRAWGLAGMPEEQEMQK